MPRQNINFSKTIIYKFVCNDLSVLDIYVGSTTDIIRRKAQHKSVCNNQNSKFYNFKIYEIMRNNGGFINWSMLQVEAYPCENKMQCSVRERYWLENLTANMNMQIPGRTQKESVKNYQETNREQINERQNTKNTCSCGGKYTQANKLKHLKSVKHIKYCPNIIIPTPDL